ncbi:zinc ribbon domain-containing protein [Butyrivibrio sp. INlla16]|uniref:zinc ribbon domain-containing protein n=1 Tax=Butyrivibrio sp. INlla16 TaxID=1520807 RepID=UPI0008878720|nr:zinc ribbon domain-containing protein [Butyrivibrio sp. INlla16]SDB49973.1 zinc-ribbon family protein [Butyrivibrio sp. INlla16]
MFLIMGIEDGSKELGFDQLIICKCCGRYGHMHVYMYYTYFMLFFIPIFKWNKRYVAVMDCCGASCELDSETGKAIANGSITYLDPDRMNFSGGGHSSSYGYGSTHKVCRNCGYSTDEDFEFCPKCGRRFD